MEGIDRHLHYAKWSTVKNPFGDSGYALPYGFVQSPILASLVLKHSALGHALTEVSKSLTVSVFVDDISLSARDKKMMMAAYEQLKCAMLESGFAANKNKMRPPTQEIDVFNCDLKHNYTAVQSARLAAFGAIERSIHSQSAFERYCQQVSLGNTVG